LNGVNADPERRVVGDDAEDESDRHGRQGDRKDENVAPDGPVVCREAKGVSARDGRGGYSMW
jgi:hypothetical protein